MKRLALLASACALGVACSNWFEPTDFCRADYLLSEHTDVLARGRRVPVSAQLYRILTPDSVARRRWGSSNTAVLRVHGDGSVEGVSAGSAVLTVRACNLTEAFAVQVIANGYSTTFLGEGTVGVALNDSGEVVGLDSPSATSGWLWRKGTRTATQGCRPRDLNNSARVLCAGTGPTTWSAGTLTVHDTVNRLSIAINDSGHVLTHNTGGSGAAAIRWRGPGDHVESGQRFMSVSGMNARGDVVGAGGFDMLYPDAWVWRVGSGSQALPGFGRYSSAGDINASGVVVGVSEYMNGGGTNKYVAVMWSPSGVTSFLRDFEGAFPNPLATGAVGINDDGLVIANGSMGGVLWTQGKLGILTHMLSDPDWQVLTAQRINARGQILASVRNTATGQTGAAILSPP